MSTTYTWSQKPFTASLSGSNPNRDPEHRYLYRTLWDEATIGALTFEWHKGIQCVKLSLSGYTFPTRKASKYQTGDWIWIAGYGEYEVLDTDYSNTIWISADFNEVASVAGGTKTYRTRSWRVTEPGTDRFGYLDTTASIETNSAMSTYLQMDWEPTFYPSLKESNLSYLRYYAITGSEAVMRWAFDDNRFSGSVAFVSSDTSAPPFAVGDQVVIQQEQTAWTYTDNVFAGGKVAFTGSTAAPFPVNSQIYITGQSIQPAYNGATAVYATASGLLTSWKPWLTDTALDGGIIYGYSRPEYNTTATITNTFVSQSLRWVVTDIPWAGNSVAIPGEMLSANSTRKKTWSAINTNNVYQMNRGASNYLAGDFVFGGYSAAFNNFSSIIANQGYYHPVQATDSGYLLAIPAVDYDGTDLGIQVKTFDATGTEIAHAEGLIASYNTAPETAFAFPYGLKDLQTLLGVSLVSDAVASYIIQPWSDQETDVFGDMVSFRITKDCVGLDPYCVLWEDSLGSVTSFPFNMVSTIADEFDRAFWNPSVNNTATLNTTTKTKWRVNSAFIQNEYEDLVIRDLLSATKVWLKTTTELIPVNITTTEYNYGNRKWGDLPNVTLDLVQRVESVRI